MRARSRSALLRGAAALVVVFAAANAASAGFAYLSVHVFDIPSKPLLAALADFSAATGLQVIRPGAQRLSGAAPAVSGRRTAESALKTLLAGSGLTFRPVGPRTVALESVGQAEPEQFEGEATDLEQIDVVGRRTGVRRPDVGKIDVTPEDLERKQPSDIRDVFAGEPGIQVGGTIPLSQKLYVHGVDETNLAVSIDGAPQNNKVFHHNATTVIDPSLLKTVRVDPGVAPADAGFGALAGSVAYETKDVADLLGPPSGPEGGRDASGAQAAGPRSFGGFSKTWFNSNGAVFGESVGVYGRKNGFEALGFFNIARGGTYRAGEGERVLGSATNLKSGLGKLAYEADGGERFEFAYEKVSDDALRPYRANAGAIEIPTRKEPLIRSYDLDRDNLVFSYMDTTPEGWWDPKIVLSWSRTRVGLPIYGWDGVTFTKEDPPRRLYAFARDAIGEASTYAAKAENKFSFDKGSITAGVDSRRVSSRIDFSPVDYDPLSGDLPSRERATQAGVYAQARLEPIERARLSFGGRADYQRFRGVNGSPGAKKDHGGLGGNVSGEYDLVPQLLTARAGYSHVWGGVPLAESFVFDHRWRYRNAREKLRAATSDNVTLGLLARRGGLTLEGSLFGTDIDNARAARYGNAYDPDVDGPMPGDRLGAVWAPDLRSRGFEIGAGYSWETGFARAKWAHVDVDINGKRGDSDIGNYIASPVGDIFMVSAAHTFVPYAVTIGGDVEIAPKYRRTGSAWRLDADDRPEKYRLAHYRAYQVVNAFIEYKPAFTRFETTFRIDLKNLLDRKYGSRASYGGEFDNVTPLYEPGRSAILSAAVKF